MSGLRVFFINSICGRGSTGRLIEGLMDALSKEGAECLAAYGRYGAPKYLNTYRVGSNIDVYLHGALSRITDRHALYSNRATEKLINTIKAFDPDILHIHNLHGYYLNYAILFKYIRKEFLRGPKKRRIIWTLHDCWCFTGHCTHYAYTGCNRWKKLCHDCPEKDQYPRSFFADSSEMNYRLKKRLFTGLKDVTLVTPSEWLKGEVEKSFLREYPVKVIPTGIDLETFKAVPSELRQRYGIGSRTLLLGVANPWRERKGFDDFIELAISIGDKYRIAMVGLKPKQLKGLPKNVIGITHTESTQEMAEWYSEADIFLNLTHEDTFPTTNLEALACGTPVITYDAGGSPESITEDTGRIVRCGDVVQVIRQIGELQKQDREKTGALCRERAECYRASLRFRQYLEEAYNIDS